MLPFEVRLYTTWLSVSWSYDLYNSSGSSIWYNRSERDPDTNAVVYVWNVSSPNKADDTYYYYASINDPGDEFGNDLDAVELAVVGDRFYTTLEEAQAYAVANPDKSIKDKLFATFWQNAYAADFSETKYFTVFLKDGDEYIRSTFAIRVETETWASLNAGLYTSEGNYIGYGRTERDDTGEIVYIVPVPEVDATYYYYATVSNWESVYNSALDAVELAVVDDHFYSTEDARALVASNPGRNIKAQLFASSVSGAYSGDFSTARYFTVF